MTTMVWIALPCSYAALSCCCCCCCICCCCLCAEREPEASRTSMGWVADAGSRMSKVLPRDSTARHVSERAVARFSRRLVHIDTVLKRTSTRVSQFGSRGSTRVTDVSQSARGSTSFWSARGSATAASASAGDTERTSVDIERASQLVSGGRSSMVNKELTKAVHWGGVSPRSGAVGEMSPARRIAMA